MATLAKGTYQALGHKPEEMSGLDTVCNGCEKPEAVGAWRCQYLMNKMLPPRPPHHHQEKKILSSGGNKNTFKSKLESSMQVNATSYFLQQIDNEKIPVNAKIIFIVFM